MNIEEIVRQIDGEISKLQQAKGLLLGSDASAPAKRSAGRPKKAAVARILAVKPAKRVMSAEGKARIVAALKARWAKVHKAQKATAKNAATKKPVKKSVKVTPAKAPASVATTKA